MKGKLLCLKILSVSHGFFKPMYSDFVSFTKALSSMAIVAAAGFALSEYQDRKSEYQYRKNAKSLSLYQRFQEMSEDRNMVIEYINLKDPYSVTKDQKETAHRALQRITILLDEAYYCVTLGLCDQDIIVYAMRPGIIELWVTEEHIEKGILAHPILFTDLIYFERTSLSVLGMSCIESDFDCDLTESLDDRIQKQ